MGRYSRTEIIYGKIDVVTFPNSIFFFNQFLRVFEPSRQCYYIHIVIIIKHQSKIVTADLHTIYI